MISKHVRPTGRPLALIFTGMKMSFIKLGCYSIIKDFSKFHTIHSI